MINKSEFKPAWWLPTGHLQTIAPMIYRQKKVPLVKEVLELPDGDFVELAWTEKPTLNDVKPIIIVLHGIEGSVQSHYAKTILRDIQQKGWIGLFMHFRGCGELPNRHPQCYHSGETKDVRYLISQVKLKYPGVPLLAIGFSLGGNVLAKLLGEYSAPGLNAGVIVSAPLNLAKSADKINDGVSKIYREYLLSGLKSHMRLKINQGLMPHITLKQLNAIKTLRDFDDLITAPVNNFSNADEYYQHCSGWRFLKSIKTPTLVLHANDDPFLNIKSLPSKAELSEQVIFEASDSGGHIGFVSGKNPFKPVYWFAKRALDFLGDHLKTS